MTIAKINYILTANSLPNHYKHEVGIYIIDAKPRSIIIIIDNYHINNIILISNGYSHIMYHVNKAGYHFLKRNISS